MPGEKEGPISSGALAELLHPFWGTRGAVASLPLPEQEVGDAAWARNGIKMETVEQVVVMVP